MHLCTKTCHNTNPQYLNAVPAPSHTDLTYADRMQGLKLYLQTAGASALFDAIDHLSTIAHM